MMPVHYIDGRDSPVGRCEVETVEDIDRAIIDAFEERWVVDVDDGGNVECQTCDGGCEHEDKIRGRLRSITETEDTDEEVEERPVPTPNG
jgi:hypothetical protein